MSLLRRLRDVLGPDRQEIDERIKEREKAIQELERRRREVMLSQLQDIRAAQRRR